jgi:hypothetical protein
MTLSAPASKRALAAALTSLTASAQAKAKFRVSFKVLPGAPTTQANPSQSTAMTNFIVAHLDAKVPSHRLK